LEVPLGVGNSLGVEVTLRCNKESLNSPPTWPECRIIIFGIPDPDKHMIRGEFHMSASWFMSDLGPSRHSIENSMRLSFWEAGLKQMWFTCVKEHAPIQCTGKWHETNFTVEFEPKKYLMLRMKEPNPDLLKGFERVLGHRALAAYRTNGEVVVEWRVRDADARFRELQSSSAQELQRIGS
jgi:hypothetical protein